MTEFELWQMLMDQQRQVTDQFQFWMATTFAMVIASYTAGDRLAIWARLAIAMLYAIAVAIFLARYSAAVEFAGGFMAQLREMSDVPVTEFPVGTMRRFLMFGGSAVAIVLICWPSIAERK